MKAIIRYFYWELLIILSGLVRCKGYETQLKSLIVLLAYGEVVLDNNTPPSYRVSIDSQEEAQESQEQESERVYVILWLHLICFLSVEWNSKQSPFYPIFSETETRRGDRSSCESVASIPEKELYLNEKFR